MSANLKDLGNINQSPTLSDDDNLQLYKTYLDWTHERLKLGENVTLPDFARSFGFTIEQDAYHAFEVTVNSTTIAHNVRPRILQQYETWKRNFSEAFWATLQAKHQIKVSTNMAVGEIIQGSNNVRKRYISEYSQNEQLPALINHSFQNDSSQAAAVLPLTTPLRVSAQGVHNSDNRAEGTGRQDSPNHEQHLDVSRQKKPRTCSSPSPLYGASSVSSRHTPPYTGGSDSSPELSTISPPSPPDFTLDRETMKQEADSFFASSGSLQDILLSNLQDGKCVPKWAINRPLYIFKLKLREEWGPRVTNLYEAAKTKPVLDHTHIDEIALLSGIVHLDQTHVGFTPMEMSKIMGEVLQTFYTKEMEETDMQRAEDASILWAEWVKKLRLLELKEKLEAQRVGRSPVDVDLDSVLETISSSYAECKAKNITSIYFIAHYIFRHYNNWSMLSSESDCMVSVVSPILREIMGVQHKIKFTCANFCTSSGRTRKVKLEQDGQSRQPDVIGQTQDGSEVFFGELKGTRPSSESVNTDILRLAIFSKDSLDLFHNNLERCPPLLTFQTTGPDVVFFLGAKIENTIIHGRLSNVKLPSSMTDIEIGHETFFRLFQVQTLVNITKDCLQNKRANPLQETSFPTLGTPERYDALNSPKRQKKVGQNVNTRRSSCF
ncbi:hypothetical protein BGZ49_003979 [Haplosporangium sp. Z 27]|nr:hypothetical protein BGZ49_003979 [Haplosporangium sp. Z 27]